MRRFIGVSISRSENMNRDKYGFVDKRAPFTWYIPNFSVIVEEREYHINSPVFQYGNLFWILSMRKDVDCGVTRFTLCNEEGWCEETTPFYRLSIKGDRGNDYWTSALLSHILEEVPAEYQGQFHSWLKRDASRIAPGDVLRLHLTLYERSEPPSEDVDCSDKDRQHSSSSTTGAQPKTFAESLCNQGCSSNSFGLGKLSQNFKDMFLNGEDCDAALNVKGKIFQVHAPILKSRSPVFAAMFTQEMLEKKRRVVDIEDCDPDAFREFVLYLYAGKVERLDANNVTSLHYISHKYGVEDLAAICVQFMIDNMAVDSFCEFAAVGLRHCDLRLIEFAKEFLAENLKLVFSTEKWKAFFLQNATEAYELLKKALARNELHLISDESK